MRMNKIIHPSFIREDTRGIFIEAFNKGNWKQIVYGNMKKAAVMGNHYHKLTDVLFFVVKGRVKINLLNIKTAEEATVSLSKHQGIILKRDTSHVVKFLEDSIFVMCKSRRYNMSYPDTYHLTKNY